jgi:hypothetical protein
MKNTLAMINPVSCQVTQVVADNVHLDRTESESILEEEEFISTHENEKGQKLPVYVNNNTSQVKAWISNSFFFLHTLTFCIGNLGSIKNQKSKTALSIWKCNGNWL